MRYGIPYMGSKNGIAEWVVSHFPKKENLYDLFAGGCAITHRALLTKKFSKYYINDLDGGVTRLFLEAMAGKYRDEERWISRADFFDLKDVDPYVKHCWSFGSDGRTYMYGKDIEDYKYCLHQAIVFRDYALFRERHGIDLSEIDVLNNVTSRRLAAKRVISRENRNAERSDTTLQNLENLERLQNLQNIETLQSNCNADAIVRYNGSYADVEISPNSIIYCDIPYRGTAEYNEGGFDHEVFYDWCEKQTEMVIVSEYSMPEERFVCLDSVIKRVTMSATDKTLKKEEKLFVPRHQLSLHERQLSLFA